MLVHEFTVVVGTTAAADDGLPFGGVLGAAAAADAEGSAAGGPEAAASQGAGTPAAAAVEATTGASRQGGGTDEGTGAAMGAAAADEPEPSKDMLAADEPVSAGGPRKPPRGVKVTAVLGTLLLREGARREGSIDRAGTKPAGGPFGRGFVGVESGRPRCKKTRTGSRLF